jgi:hypothetical protein
MGAFSKFQKSKAMGGTRNYLKAGDHVIRIQSVKFDRSRTGVDFFAVQGVVVETDSDEPTMQPGQRVDWSTHADKDPYAGNVKQFFMAAHNFNEPEVDALEESEFEEAMELLTGQEQTANNRLVLAVCREATSKKGNDYVATQWVGIADEDQA